MSPGGETGRRKGLKIPRPNGCAGSTPAPGTIINRKNVIAGKDDHSIKAELDHREQL